MTGWLSLISGVVALVRLLAQWISDNEKIDAAVSAAVLRGLRDADDAISRAKAARTAADADNAAGTDRLRHDKYERGDDEP